MLQCNSKTMNGTFVVAANSDSEAYECFKNKHGPCGYPFETRFDSTSEVKLTICEYPEGARGTVHEIRSPKDILAEVEAQGSEPVIVGELVSFSRTGPRPLKNKHADKQKDKTLRFVGLQRKQKAESLDRRYRRGSAEL